MVGSSVRGRGSGRLSSWENPGVSVDRFGMGEVGETGLGWVSIVGAGAGTGIV